MILVDDFVPVLLQNEVEEVHETPAQAAALHGMSCSSQPEGGASDREPFGLSRFACHNHRGVHLLQGLPTCKSA